MNCHGRLGISASVSTVSSMVVGLSIFFSFTMAHVVAISVSGSYGTKSVLLTAHSGQRHESGISMNSVPGFTQLSISPTTDRRSYHRGGRSIFVILGRFLFRIFSE